MSTKLTVVSKERSIKDEMTDDFLQELVEALLPKVKPIIKPAMARFSEFMNNGNKIVIQSVDGRAMIFVIREDDVDKFELKEGAEPVNIYDSETFVEMILSGTFK